MLKHKIETDFWKALKERKVQEYSILRLLRAEILNKEKEKRYKLSKEKPDLSEMKLEQESSLTDEEVLIVIASRIKKGKESIASFEKGNRDDLVKKEKKEIEVLKRYLPAQLPEEEIRKIVEKAIEKIKPDSIKDMGKVMSEIMPKVKGKADGSLISKIVKEMIS
jgi:uncharacterized protein YqeY